VTFSRRRCFENALNKSCGPGRGVRRLVDLEYIGVIDLDGSGKVIDANDAFLEMTGYSREELTAGDVYWRTFTCGIPRFWTNTPLK